MRESILLAQVTDSHLLAQTTAELRGCNPWYSFNRVLQAVVQCQPDGLLLTGDLAEQGDRAAYEQLVGAIAPLQLPTYWLPGNHDHRPTLQQVFQQLPQSQGLTSIDLGPWQLILLDSVLPQAKFGEGYLSDEQLQQLHQNLSQAPNQPTLISLHHHPVPVGIDWVDQMQVQNSPGFLELLAQFSQVKLVVFGHIHHGFQQQTVDGVSFYGCPSTCLQVTSPELDVTDERPGFRLIWLDQNGSYRTEVKRVGGCA
ncbi:phosphodiesterase [Leptothoe sp. PORK10 BA2]|uniref:phosphodiesterase n=1 Tax=Leptothoe sp. PORK10 BA2 TaxID=3110254 RepID=UPI002B1FA983|nr:phosphodiesterase [Leptothoe sp. PORK10 BA2]MEA5466248.1 phosphodiesterase [Leptothoe sp. PORK10 BA2]